MKPLVDVLLSPLELALAVLGPACCAGCDAPPKPRAAFCEACGARLGPPSQGWLGDLPVVAAGAYDDVIAAAVRRLKYQGRVDLARPLGRHLGEIVRRASPDAAVAVPVPLHPVRLARRGYNQAALIARGVARALDIPMEPTSLERAHESAPQASLRRRERLIGPRGAFRARPGRRLRGRAVLLVDDVITTGATALACREALEGAGARIVGLAALARTRAPPRLLASRKCDVAGPRAGI